MIARRTAVKNDLLAVDRGSLYTLALRQIEWVGVDPIPVPKALEIMQKEASTAIDARCMQALRTRVPSWNVS